MFVTPLELALISPVAALIGVAVGIGGNGYLDRLRERRAARRERDQAIAELLTATVDLLSGVQTVRAVYQQQTRWRHYLRVTTILMSSIGSMLTAGETISWDLLNWRRMSPSLERLLTEDRELDDRLRTTGLDLATNVIPRTTRFYAAVAVLTLGDDKPIADAVRGLTDAVGKLMEVIGAKEKKYTLAREHVGEALRAFRTVADQRLR